MIELKCLTCIHGELCSYKHGGVDLAIISGDCKSYKSTADVVPKSEVDDLKRYIILNENIAIKCKQENGEQNEEYWKGKISAFKQIRAYIDAELKNKYTEGEKEK